VEVAKEMVLAIIKTQEEEYPERVIEKSTPEEIQPVVTQPRIIPGFTNKQNRQPKPMNSSVVKPVETSPESSVSAEPEKVSVPVQNHNNGWTSVPIKGKRTDGTQDDPSKKKKKKKGEKSTPELRPEPQTPIEREPTPELVEPKLVKVESKKTKEPQLIVQDILQRVNNVKKVVQTSEPVLSLPERPTTPVEEEIVDEWVEVNPGRKTVKAFKITPNTQNQLQGISISNNALNLISTDPLPNKKKNKKKKKTPEE
jgi:hypothetical protein